jgi:Fe-S-cluster-containing dehydrogenase component
MKKWHMLIDVALCENCNNCVLSAKDEYVGNEFPGYTAPQPLHGHKWIDIKRRVRGEGSMVDAAHVPVMCNHCDNAPCVKAGGGAVKKREDGIVIIDPAAAKGRREIVDACPYGAVFWNEELQLPQHWPFDAHLLDQGWVRTRGTQSCPTGAMRSVHAEEGEFAQMIQKNKLEVLNPEFGTNPRVYYKNLHRFTKCFIGGSVVAQIDGMKECVADAKVEIWSGSSLIAGVTSDGFGDFKFDSIEPGSGSYSVKIEHPKHGRANLSIAVGAESVYAGEIPLA